MCRFTPVLVINPLELNTPPLEITCQHGYICGASRIDKAVITNGIRDRRLGAIPVVSE